MASSVAIRKENLTEPGAEKQIYKKYVGLTIILKYKKRYKDKRKNHRGNLKERNKERIEEHKEKKRCSSRSE